MHYIGACLILVVSDAGAWKEGYEKGLSALGDPTTEKGFSILKFQYTLRQLVSNRQLDALSRLRGWK